MTAVGAVLVIGIARVGLRSAPVARIAAPLFDIFHLGLATRRTDGMTDQSLIVAVVRKRVIPELTAPLW